MQIQLSGTNVMAYATWAMLQTQCKQAYGAIKSSYGGEFFLDVYVAFAAAKRISSQRRSLTALCAAVDPEARFLVVGKAQSEFEQVLQWKEFPHALTVLKYPCPERLGLVDDDGGGSGGGSGSGGGAAAAVPTEEDGALAVITDRVLCWVRGLKPEAEVQALTAARPHGADQSAIVTRITSPLVLVPTTTPRVGEAAYVRAAPSSHDVVTHELCLWTPCVERVTLLDADGVPVPFAASPDGIAWITVMSGTLSGDHLWNNSSLTTDMYSGFATCDVYGSSSGASGASGASSDMATVHLRGSGRTVYADPASGKPLHDPVMWLAAHTVIQVRPLGAKPPTRAIVSEINVLLVHHNGTALGLLAMP